MTESKPASLRPCDPASQAPEVVTDDKSPSLHVEDYAYATSRAREIVDRAMQRDFLAVIEHATNRVRAAFGYPPGVPLSDRERAEALLFRIGLHVRRNP